MSGGDRPDHVAGVVCEDEVSAYQGGSMMLNGDTAEALVELAVVTVLAGVATVVGGVAIVGYVVWRMINE